jgi:hypothetical protein
VWIVKRYSLRDHAARRVAYEGRFLDADRVHERIHIGGVVVPCVAAFGLI